MAWVPFASGTPGKTFYALECLSVGFGGKQLPDSCGSDVIVDTGTVVSCSDDITHAKLCRI
eukprot:m.1374899 g.1374899  ORF g.1374899 m.1374899 type:complete len:61 (+) comp24960_c1_seq26:1129-1311(+)